MFGTQAIGDHLAVLSPVAAAAVTPQQSQELTYGQAASLIRVRNLAFTRLLGRPDSRSGDKPSSAARTRRAPLTLALTTTLTITLSLGLTGLTALGALLAAPAMA